MQDTKQKEETDSRGKPYVLRSARSTGALNSKVVDDAHITRSKTNIAAQLVSDDGYDLEDHDVVTEDGYILTLHRLPRPHSRDAVFFQHGILGGLFLSSFKSDQSTIS